MYPAFDIFGVTIPTYGLLVTFGILLGTVVIIFLSPDKKIPREDLFYSICFGAIGLIIGAKVLSVIQSMPIIIQYYQNNPFSMDSVVFFLRQGFVFYGGLIGALLMVWIYARAFKISFWALSDRLIIGVPLMHAIGRIGCFLAGCCYGRASDAMCAVTFHPDSVAPQGQSFLPTQLFETGANTIIFLVVFIYSRRLPAERKTLALYLILYSIARFILEFFRGDLARGLLLNFSTSQWISLILLPVGIALFFWRRNVAKM